MENINLKNKLERNINADCQKKSFSFVLSGRTAYDLAIKDIIKKRNIEKALLPSYICESMILPFIINKIPFELYRVNFNPQNEKFTFDYNKIKETRNAIILLCDYFVPDSTYNLISSCIDESNYLIHDITHTIFSNSLLLHRDNYTVCSLRKWFDIPDGGLVISNNEGLYEIKENIEYISNKLKSKELRKIFNENPTLENKKRYKYYYNIADRILDEDFSGYKMSNISMNELLNIDIVNSLKEKRELLEKIRNILVKKDINILFNNQSLFTMPICINNEKRDALLERFQNSGVKCTVFWDYNKYNQNMPNFIVDNTICLDISQNTLSKMKVLVERRD